MASMQTLIRDELVAQVDAAKLGYVLPTLQCEAAFIPQENIESLVAVPKAKFVSIGFEGQRDRALRNRTAEQVIPVQVAVQQKVAPFIVSTIDQLVELAEQIQDTCENDFVVSGRRYSWMMTLPLRDENGLTYTYQQLSQIGVFQAIFTVHFKTIIDRTC